MFIEGYKTSLKLYTSWYLTLDDLTESKEIDYIDSKDQTCLSFISNAELTQSRGHESVTQLVPE